MFNRNVMAVLCILMLPACVYVPPIWDLDDEINYADFEVGKTTKKEVLASLGAPHYGTKDSGVFLYEGDISSGFFLIVGPTGGGGGLMTPETWWVRIVFDDRDIVRSVTSSRDDQKPVLVKLVFDMEKSLLEDQIAFANSCWAANNGEWNGRVKTGLAYWHGIGGVQQDRVRAHALFSLANVDDPRLTWWLIDRFEIEIGPSELKKARKLANNWKLMDCESFLNGYWDLGNAADVELGLTTKEQVLVLLGDPHYGSSGSGVFLYDSEKISGATKINASRTSPRGLSSPESWRVRIVFDFRDIVGSIDVVPSRYLQLSYFPRSVSRMEISLQASNKVFIDACKLANKGKTYERFKIGLAYWHGIGGVKQDRVRAHALFSLANVGDPSKENDLVQAWLADQLEQNMSPYELDQVQDHKQIWKPLDCENLLKGNK